MNSQHLNYKIEDHIAFLTIDRPPVNALNRELVTELGRAAEQIQNDVDVGNVRSVIITAHGKFFCAGADLKERMGMPEEQVAPTVKNIGESMRKIAEISVPTIAALQGSAFGGGFEVALAADIRIVVDSAQLGKMAAELEKTESLEDISDQLAETLFGNEELEAISMQIREEAAPVEESPVALEPANDTPTASAEAAPAPESAGNPPTPPPPMANTESEIDPAANAAPASADRGPQLDAIENQFDSSMSATLKNLNSRTKSPDREDESEDSSGGLLGRLKDTFKS